MTDDLRSRIVAALEECRVLIPEAHVGRIEGLGGGTEEAL